MLKCRLRKRKEWFTGFIIIISIGTCLFSDYYVSTENIYNIFTRSRKQIHLKKTKANRGSKSIKITGAIVYNSLPPHIRDSKLSSVLNNL